MTRLLGQNIIRLKLSYTFRPSLDTWVYFLILSASISCIALSCSFAFSIVPSNNLFHNTDAWNDNVLPSLSGGNGGTTELVSVDGIGTHCAFS